MSYVVVYDACVLYPAPLRDFLMHLALTELFQARWSDAIHDEWIRNVLADRPNLRSRLQRTRTLMDKAVPDSLVTGYEPLIEKLDLPDPDDRHVLAAAIRCGAQAIVTFNLKDFPAGNLALYDVEAIHPDDFVELQFDLRQELVLQAAKHQRSMLKAPPKSAGAYLDTLSSQGLVKTASLLQPYSEFI